jgi:hypothetical protein
MCNFFLSSQLNFRFWMERINVHLNIFSSLSRVRVLAIESERCGGWEGRGGQGRLEIISLALPLVLNIEGEKESSMIVWGGRERERERNEEWFWKAINVVEIFILAPSEMNECTAEREKCGKMAGKNDFVCETNIYLRLQQQ